ncbi:MAG: hypothetical protein VXY34_04910 [Bdellovibrionota bacterium]|nr:hypothetical protein [Bdellovibrionota bacterium]
MSKFTSIFKKFDKIIFKQVDAYKSSSFYLQSLDQFNTLDENVQKIIKQVSSFFIIFLPIALVFAIFLNNKKIGDRVKFKKDILKTLYSIDSKTRQLSFYENRIASPYKISSKKDLKNRIINVARANSISSQKIVIGNYSQIQGTSRLSQTQAKISFKDLSTKELTKLLAGLVKKEKVKISDMSIKVDTKERLLKGHISVIHFSKTK